MMATDPSPTIAARRSPLSRKGRGFKSETQPSPLAGEGGALAPGEGALNRTLNFAKTMRHDMTDSETKLWQELRAHRFESYKFKRQQPIGKYIADFVCLKQRLIVEVDGSQHDGSGHDKVRDEWLSSQDFRVLRFWNVDDLTAMDGVLIAILSALKEKP